MLKSPQFLSDKLLIATGNKGKVKEFAKLFSLYAHDKNINLTTLDEFKALNIIEPEENADSFIANAELKARYYNQITGLSTLADDSGLCVDALDGLPGIYSARWAGENKDFTIAIKRIENEVGTKTKRAKFVCALSLCKQDQTIINVEGEVFGTLVFPAVGLAGFGYDPIFIPDGYTKTFGELPAEVKEQISHRAIAFKELIKYI